MKLRMWSPIAACAVVVVVAVCLSKAQSAPMPVIVHSANRAAANAAFLKPPGSSLSGELLIASNVVVAPDCTETLKGSTFKASGTAKGPYPGTFSASGDWATYFDWKKNGYFWDFNETFAITSGTSTISGTINARGLGHAPIRHVTCHSFGPAGSVWGLTYSSGSWSGTATTGKITRGQLSESLQ
jgi:hypothetical protein